MHNWQPSFLICTAFIWGGGGKSYLLGLVDGGLAGRALVRLSRHPRHLRSSPHPLELTDGLASCVPPSSFVVLSLPPPGENSLARYEDRRQPDAQESSVPDKYTTGPCFCTNSQLHQMRTEVEPLETLF